MLSVVIIDDQSTSRKILEELVFSLGEDISIKSFSDPVAALESVQISEPDLVLTDIKMPRLDGVEFTHLFRTRYEDVPLIVITGIEDREIRYRALESGATDFLTKPVDHNEFRVRCHNLLELRRHHKISKGRTKWLEEKVSEATQAISIRERETLLRLAKAGEYRDEETGNHVLRMAKYSYIIAKNIGLPEDECRVIEVSATMHDIGKIGIPDSILRKPGKLTDEEFRSMKRHADIGHEILKDSPSKYLQTGAVIALGHHEKFDGSGYPSGLRGDDIPLPARIVAVADVFDALTSRRPYKDSWSVKDAFDYLNAEKGAHFDPDCIEAFHAALYTVETICQSLRDLPPSGTDK
jgi:two-component system response regulator RpfG